MRRRISALQVAATYIGTVVGAGFASGQEILQFFSFFGKSSLPGVLVATGLFVFFGLIIMTLGHDLRAKSYLPVIRYTAGRQLGSLIDVIITFFLFGGLSAMAAGSGAIFYEQFGLPKVVGSLVMVGLTTATVLFGLAGVITAISVVVPLLFTAVLFISILTIVGGPIGPGTIPPGEPARAAVPTWPLSALNYASYNILMSTAILAPLGAAAKSPGAIRRGALIGGIGLGLGAFAINLAILVNLPASSTVEVPMILIAGAFSPKIQFGYSLVLMAEIYTTAVADLFGFSVRVVNPESTKFRWVVLSTAFTGLIAAQLGFSKIVRTLYSAAGYAGFLLLLTLLYTLIRQSRNRIR